MGTEPSKKYDVKFQGDNQLVVGVSWHDCNKFCKKLSMLTGKEFRLPTEAEWEYACRAKTTTPFHFGETITPALVNYNGKFPYGNAPPNGEYREKTVDVDSFSPNAWGLYQMHGNVWEWCLDEWHDSYNSKPQNLRDNGSEPWGETGVSDNNNVIVCFGAVLGSTLLGIAALGFVLGSLRMTTTLNAVFGLFLSCRGLLNPLPSLPFSLYPLLFTLSLRLWRWR
jgi:hypothetical protein